MLMKNYRLTSDTMNEITIQLFSNQWTDTEQVQTSPNFTETYIEENIFAICKTTSSSDN